MGSIRTVAKARTAPRVIAVTGAAGFLGRGLIHSLEADPRVRRIVAIDVQPAASATAKTRAYDLDLTAPAAEARLAEILSAEHVEALAHLAFLPAPSQATAWAHELESLGTMHVAVAVRQAKVRKLVHWSLTWLYGAHPSNPNFLSESHPLRAPRSEPFFLDKVEAEEQVRKLAQPPSETTVTILRTAPIVGPTAPTVATRYLSRKLVPTMMGFDPMVQLLHEADAVAAFHAALAREAPGTFNIVGRGVLPLSAAIRIAGRVAVPVPHPVAEIFTSIGWMAQLVEAPAGFLRYLRFLCVADGARAKEGLGFEPTYTSREALLDLTRAVGLREVRMLPEEAT
jgi:UDP-glucose 4-epimerase